MNWKLKRAIGYGIFGMVAAVIVGSIFAAAGIKQGCIILLATAVLVTCIIVGAILTTSD